MAHWIENLDDPEYKIYRPRQIYIGQDLRAYAPIDERGGEPLVKPNLDGRGVKSNPVAAQRREAGELFDIDVGFPC